jgi:UDP-glucose:(heptosyl)LPS alpha-1,3-glucosyltransferase
MKVAIVQEHVDPQRGGAETSTLEMARELAALDLDVTVVCAAREGASAAGATADAAVADGVRLHRLPVYGASRTRRTVQFVAAADRFARQQRFDIIHAVTPCFSCNVYQPRGGTYVETVERSIARSRTAIGRLVRRIGRRLNYRQRFLLLVERDRLSDLRPPHVAAISRYGREQVERWFPHFPGPRLHVVLNGVCVEPFSAAEFEQTRHRAREMVGAEPGETLLLFVAHNFALKGLRQLIDACAELEATARWRLLVAGRDSAAPYVRQARRRGVASRVWFLGSTDVRALYAAADLLVHPTWYDPCSRVVLEALCYGVPVVTTRYNGAIDAFTDESLGVVIDEPSDVGALRRAIEAGRRLPRIDPQRTAELCESLSMARHARELKALYETVVEEQSQVQT